MFLGHFLAVWFVILSKSLVVLFLLSYFLNSQLRAPLAASKREIYTQLIWNNEEIYYHMRQESKNYGNRRNRAVRALGPLRETLCVLRPASLAAAGRLLQQLQAPAPGGSRRIQRGRHSLFLCDFYWEQRKLFSRTISPSPQPGRLSLRPHWPEECHIPVPYLTWPHKDPPPRTTPPEVMAMWKRGELLTAL